MCNRALVRVDDDDFSGSGEGDARIGFIPLHIEHHGRLRSQGQIEQLFARVDVEEHEFVHGDGESLSVARELKRAVVRGDRAYRRGAVEVHDAYGQALGRAVRRVIGKAFAIGRQGHVHDEKAGSSEFPQNDAGIQIPDTNGPLHARGHEGFTVCADRDPRDALFMAVL